MDRGTTREAIINCAALRKNTAIAYRFAEGRELIGVVKADAYGHGAAAVAKVLLEQGCRRLAVVTVDEAVVLRDAGLDSPEILVLAGLQNRAEAEEATRSRLTPVIHGNETLSLAVAAGRVLGSPLSVEVEVDTGMSRMGVASEQATNFLVRVARAPDLELSGVFTHFSRADEIDLAPCLEQLSSFRRTLHAARAQGVWPRSIHVANSAGLLAGKPILDALPEVTAVRPGLLLYGVRPAPHFDDVPLRAVMVLQARVVRLQNLVAGQPVGYGAGYRAGQRTRIATLPLGYADGISCASSGKGWVWLAGKRRPIVGRVSMDSITIDVGWQEREDCVRLGDRAVIFGNGEIDEAGISVEEAATWSGTISYELLVRVGPRVPRRVLDPADSARLT